MRQLVAGVSMLALVGCQGTTTINPTPSPLGPIGPVADILVNPADMEAAAANWNAAVTANFDVAQNTLFGTCQTTLNTDFGIGLVPNPNPQPGQPVPFNVTNAGLVSGFSVIVLNVEKANQAVVSGIQIPQSCAEAFGLMLTTVQASFLSTGPVNVSIVPDPPAIAALKGKLSHRLMLTSKPSAPK